MKNLNLDWGFDFGMVYRYEPRSYFQILHNDDWGRGEGCFSVFYIAFAGFAIGLYCFYDHDGRV